MQKEPQIGLLTEGGISAGMRLSGLAGWNQTASDWHRLLNHDPLGCFVASIDNRVVGTATSTVYGTDLAWIGMVLVHPDYRRRGIATRLMQTTLNSLLARGVKTIKLDATPAGRPVYETLGFTAEELIQRWTGTAKSATEKEWPVWDEELKNSMFALDRRAFGADRAKLLESLIKGSCVPPRTLGGPVDQLSGYAFARDGVVANYVGPLVACDQTSAASLLDAMMAQLAGCAVFIDINTGFEGAGEIARVRGLVKQRDLIRMRRGLESGAGTSPLIFAIAGPEVG